MEIINKILLISLFKYLIEILFADSLFNYIIFLYTYTKQKKMNNNIKYIIFRILILNYNYNLNYTYYILKLLLIITKKKQSTVGKCKKCKLNLKFDAY